MKKIEILCVGRSPKSWIKSAADEYLKRISGQVLLTTRWLRMDAALDEQQVEIALDPKGKLLTSEEFAAWIEQLFIERGSRLRIAIGGASGLPKKTRQQCHHLLSLSPLTFPHQIAYLLLVEQLYRAAEIWKGSAYHK